MPLDHLGIRVPSAQYDQIVSFYLAALAPIGYSKMHDFGVACGLGNGKEADFWIASLEKEEGAEGEKGTKANDKGVHFAFRASDHETVNKFHEAALKAGGKCNGPPGLREMYHPNYYGAFILDPLG
jgi:hypothetical protein